MKTELKIMQPVAVSATSEEHALECLSGADYNYYYLFTDPDGRVHIRYVDKNCGGEGTRWYWYVAAIPEKKSVPYTYETFPKCHTLVRFKKLSSIYVVNAIKVKGIEIAEGAFNFETMGKGIELSFDNGETWQPFWLEE